MTMTSEFGTVPGLDVPYVRRKLEALPRSYDPLDPAVVDSDWIRYGLPPRPPGGPARAMWAEMVAALSGVSAPATSFQILAPPPSAESGGFMPMIEGGSADDVLADIPRAGRLISSSNWSGAAIIPNRGRRFVQVLARWKVPEVTAGLGDGPHVCSTWIGLDGLRSWMTSMPQMGTTQIAGDVGPSANGPVPPYLAWWQWWLKGRVKQIPVQFNTAIGAGDTVSCCVTRLPQGQPALGDQDLVQFFLRVVPANGSNPPAENIEVASPPDNDVTGEGRHPPVPARGASAQWILERPTALWTSPNGKVREGDLYPLPDFGACSPEGFVAVQADAPDPSITQSDVTPPPELEPRSGLLSPRKLRMIERREDPTRIAVIADVRLEEGSVEVRYRS